LAVAAGAVATLGHAPFFIFPAYFVAIATLIWLLDAVPEGPRRWAGFFARGWWFAFGHFLSGLHWVAFAFEVDAVGSGIALGAVAAVVLAAGLALFWGLALGAATPLWRRDLRRVPVFVTFILLAEFARGHLFGGFPWLLPAYIWPAGGGVSQIASVIGAYGLSAVTLLLAGALAPVADPDANGARRFAPLVVAGLVMGLLWGAGEQRLRTARFEPPGAAPIVRVVDAGFTQAEKWTVDPDDVLVRYLELSGDPAQSRGGFVIWPEGAIPASRYALVYGDPASEGGYALEPSRAPYLGEIMGDRVLVAGATRCAPMPACEDYYRGVGTAEGLQWFNSAVAVDGVSGRPRLAGVYDKHRLTPFGEFIPLWDVFSAINFAPLQQIGAGFTPGPPPHRMLVDADAPPLVVHICYESIFPGLTPRGEERPGWIVNVTNDAWFGSGVGPHQHFNIARYRSIEEGLPMARAASGGVSAIIDAYGRAVRVADPEVGYAEVQLPPTLEPTWYARFGWAIVPLLLLAIFALRFSPGGAGRGLRS
jgi:apolipoprotein N-acyltransferase